MKIKAEKWIVDGSISYKLLKVEKCCDKLINSSYITLNNEYGISDDYENSYSVKLYKEDDDYFNECSYDTIKFCPYCGKPIIIEVINEVDKTKEYKVLEKQREELRNKCYKTDSKKKENELNIKIKELDRKINSMLLNDDLMEVNNEK